MEFPFGAIGSLAGQIGQAISQKKQNEAQRKWATEQQTLAWKRNLEQWKRENEYNDPSQQMARLKAAGLNPNMVYGDGATTQAASSPTFREAEGQFTSPLGHLNPLAVSNASVAQQQARSIKLENMKKEYDLGLRTPESFLTDIVVNGEVQYIYKTTNVPYYNRIKRTADKVGADATYSEFRARLAEQNINIHDNLLVRMLAQAAKDKGLPLDKVTEKSLNWLLGLLGLENE